jgi:sulfonate transport system permease protein
VEHVRVTRAPSRRADARSFVLPLALALVWAAAAASGHWNSHLLVPPKQLSRAFLESAKNGDFWLAAGTSMVRLAAGWSIGSLVGVALGVVVGCSKLAERLAAPSLNGVRQVALFAWIPLLTAWLGSGDAAKIILIALAAFFPAALNAQIGCRATPAALLEVGRVLEFDSWTTLRRIVLPSARPSIVAGLQIALTSAWIGTIGAEYLLDQGAGLGVFLASARMDNRMDIVLVCIVALGLAGYALSSLLRFVFLKGAPQAGAVVADD